MINNEVLSKPWRVQSRRRKVVGEIPVGERASEKASDVYRRVRERERPRFFRAPSLSSFFLFVHARNVLVSNIRCRMDRDVIRSSITFQLTCPRTCPWNTCARPRAIAVAFSFRHCHSFNYRAEKKENSIPFDRNWKTAMRIKQILQSGSLHIYFYKNGETKRQSLYQLCNK